MNVATQLAVFKVLTDLLKERHDQLKDAARDVMDPGDRKTAMLGDTKIASVSMTDPSVKVRVKDETEFTDWVAENHPTEVVTTVRDTYRRQLLEQCKKTGEAIPGVEFTDAESYPSVRLATGSHQVIADAWRDGKLPDLGALLAIEGGDQ